MNDIEDAIFQGSVAVEEVAKTVEVHREAVTAAATDLGVELADVVDVLRDAAVRLRLVASKYHYAGGA